MLSNREVARRFFNPERYISAKGSNFYFLYDSVISYSTIVAQRVQNKKGEDVLIITDDSMSRSTGKQLTGLYRFCDLDLYKAPFIYDRSKPFTLEGFATNFTNRLREIRELDFTQKPARDQYIETFNRACKFSNEVHTIIDLEDSRQLYIDLQNPDYINALKKAKRAENAKKRAETKAWNNYWRTEAGAIVREAKGYLAKLELLYRAKFRDEFGVGLGQHIEQQVKEALNPEGVKIDFVLFYDGRYVTSCGNCVDAEDGDKALKHWKTGRLSAGDRVSAFQVKEVTSTYITVGCHTLTAENLRELYRQRFNK